MNCPICHHASGHTRHTPREMMFGLRESFEYWCCGQCRMLWIDPIPNDLGRHYGQGYYSQQPPPEKNSTPLLTWLKQQRARHHLGERTLPGALMALVGRRPIHFRWLRPFGVSLSSAILDLGCGTGGLLLKLRREGFVNLTGADPFLPETIRHASGVTILAEPLERLDGRFDLIMLHHVLEHMPDQHATMERLRARLNPGGGVLIRIPVAQSHAHRRYGVHWMAWDALRHLYLHTVTSLHRLANSTVFPFLRTTTTPGRRICMGCEYYQRDIPHPEWGRHPDPPETLAAFRTLTDQLNATLDGDTACFYLKIS
ncbi:MAG: class I SAM-dependent methyltransferase [Magnetococcales bacterium]|nr:class I SAM-dependent methyltransferase [Magnetococcales bacterium]